MRKFLYLSMLLLLVNVSLAEESALPSGSDEILLPTSKLELLWNEGEFTEGVAVAPDGQIYFSNIPRGDAPGQIFRFDPKTKQTSVFSKDSGKSNGLMFNRDGKLYAACGANGGKMALCAIDDSGNVAPQSTHFRDKRLNSPNDLVIHPSGGIYFSDPRYVGDEPIELEHMSVYFFDPFAFATSRVTTDISKPNGVILSPDAKTLYVAETDNGSKNLNDPNAPKSKPRMTLNAFPILPNGLLGKRKVLVDFEDQLGVDGMTVDVEGYIYAAVRSPKRFGIVVYTPEGKEVAYIPTPKLPTNCCFGRGEEATMLYCTIGGGLYRIPLKIAGYHPATANSK